MTDYQPTSRRPIATAFRRTASLAVRLCVRLHIHPDAISYLSVVASIAAGLCFCEAARYPVLLLIGPLFCYARLWCNMLDGMVAMASGKASLRGEILNDVPDRVSDVVIFAGVAHSGLNAIPSGYWAAIAALLTAYIGTFGQAVGGKREFGGVMSKPWRMVTLHLGAWTAYLLYQSSNLWLSLAHLTVLDWTCLVIIAGCLPTSAVRLKRIFRSLHERATSRKLEH